MFPRLSARWLVAPAAGHCRTCRPVLRTVSDHRFGGDQQRGDRSRIFQRGAHHLGRVDDAELEHVAIFFGLRVEAEGCRSCFPDLASHDRAVDAGVLGDLAQRSFQRARTMSMPAFWSAFATVKPSSTLPGLDQGHAAADDDAFLNGRTGRVQRVINAVLALFHFDFGHAADPDDGNAARQLGHTLLQLFAVVVRGGFLDLRPDLADAGLDLGLVASAIDDGGVVLVDR